MNSEEMKPTGSPNAGSDNPEKSLKVENITNEESLRAPTKPVSTKPASESLNFDRVVDEAREQVTKAADAFSRGDFIQEAAMDPGANGDDRLVAALCYFVPGLISALVIFSESSKRPFQRYHAVQSLGLSAAMIAISLAYTVISAIVWAVPIIGWLVGFVLLCIAPVAFLMAVIAFLYYGYQAYLGKRFSIPGLTSYLRDQGWI